MDTQEPFHRVRSEPAFRSLIRRESEDTGLGSRVSSGASTRSSSPTGSISASVTSLAPPSTLAEKIKVTTRLELLL